MMDDQENRSVTVREPQPGTGMTTAERRRWTAIGGIARADTEADAFCVDLMRRGLADIYDSTCGTHYFVLTQEGEQAFFGENHVVDDTRPSFSRFRDVPFGALGAAPSLQLAAPIAHAA